MAPIPSKIFAPVDLNVPPNSHKDVALKLPIVKKEALDHALEVFDLQIRNKSEWEGWEINQAHRYAIQANGLLYPAKKIVSLATGLAVGDFSGGQLMNSYLKRHGFSIVDLPRSTAPELQFVIGQVYDRQTEIHDPFGGSRQSGISPSAKVPAIFLFTGDSGEQFGYTDKEEPGGVLVYTGEGQSNNMTLTKGNRAILDHAETGRALHVFRALGKGQGQRYLGEFSCASSSWRRGPDKDGKDRDIVVFNLVPVGRELDPLPFDENHGESYAARSFEELRKLAFEAAAGEAADDIGSAVRTVYRRSKRIAEYVLRRANGICESCKKPAPFLKKDGSPYLEPHHVNRLSDGGLDHPRYMGAICPDCHREIHHGVLGKEKNEQLKDYVATVETDSIS